ncbi:hypothetical protein [Pseudonocardia sp.]|jgi:hypothetical protein|uniref:hypothetical protein n=1 Tax=Pseudonocardia sp. TaxID=60912 RepID=UPI0031FE334E
MRARRWLRLPGARGGYQSREAARWGANASKALRLGSAERAHLSDLARPPRRSTTTAAVAGRRDVLRSALRQVVEAIPTTPAVIMNRQPR